MCLAFYICIKSKFKRSQPLCIIEVIDLTKFTDINSMDALEIVIHGDNAFIELSGTNYYTTIFLSDFKVVNLDNSDFLF